MRLTQRQWGSGPRTAVLVHGFSDDGGTWWRVGPALAACGFTVLAPDLRGHGRSPRSRSYELEDFAADLVDTLPVQTDLLLGHSLGALALGLAAPRLLARRTVFVDPPWLVTGVGDSLLGPLPTTVDGLPPQSAAWDQEDVDVELRSNDCVDPQVAPALSDALRAGPFHPPHAPEHGSVVLVPGLDPVLSPQAHPLLQTLGYRVVTQPGVRHVMHRDDSAGFEAVLREHVLPLDEAVA